MVSRRAWLLATGGGLVAAVAGAFGLVEADVLPGRIQLAQLAGACHVPDPAPTAATGGPVVGGSFASSRRRAGVPYLIAYPPGSRPGDPLPVCLVLHGHNGSERDLVGSGQLPRYLADAVAGGVPRFALAAVAGGNGYWHPRADGTDPLGMLADEFLPVLAGRGLRTGRVGVLGYSMGGYGALLFTETYPGRTRVCVAASPAVWRSYGEAHDASRTAFDDADDFARHDVIRGAARMRGVPVRIDCGRADFFAPNMPALRDALPPGASLHLADGCHDGEFWRSVTPTHLAFLGRALAGS